MSAWLVIWLSVGQLLSMDALAAPPEARASDGPLAAATPEETAPPQTASEPPKRRDKLTTLLAEHLAALPSDSGAMWFTDAPAAGAEPKLAAASWMADDYEQDTGRDRSSARGDRLDPDLVSRGENYFESSCTACHDGERATNKRKSLAGWLAAVRRMAAKDDADIPTSQHTAIATYLASLNPAYQDSDEDDEMSDTATAAELELAAAEAAVPPFTLNGTFSPVWRGTDPDLENKGFFPDLWVGIEWRPARSPVSGKVTACTSCHGSNQGLGVELVEAAAVLDLCHVVMGEPREDRSHCELSADLTVGRFIVPFGAFSGRVHPGALRTASLPLMYNMGRRVGPISPHLPVINLPYADEGANLHLERNFFRDWDVTLDTYTVNGLQFGGPSEFFFSRSYRDNNSNLAVGGRATIGNRHWRFGGSLTGGELQNEGSTVRQNYSIAGGDVSFRYGDLFRAYYEYAIRREDGAAAPNSKATTYGNLIEAEVLLLEKPKISFLARYDTLEHRGFFGEMSTDRFTYGLNWVLPGGSLLIVDHEHWMYDSREAANVLGVRWTTAF